jgi:hypothetical protein
VEFMRGTKRHQFMYTDSCDYRKRTDLMSTLACLHVVVRWSSFNVPLNTFKEDTLWYNGTRGAIVPVRRVESVRGQLLRSRCGRKASLR